MRVVWEKELEGGRREKVRGRGKEKGKWILMKGEGGCEKQGRE